MTDPACGGIVGHAFSPCTLPDGHREMCEWQKTYATYLPDGHKLKVTVDSSGDVLLQVTFPDGSSTYGSLPELNDGLRCRRGESRCLTHGIPRRHWHFLVRHGHPEWHGHCKRGHTCERTHWHGPFRHRHTEDGR